MSRCFYKRYRSRFDNRSKNRHNSGGKLQFRFVVIELITPLPFLGREAQRRKLENHRHDAEIEILGRSEPSLRRVHPWHPDRLDRAGVEFPV
ncbi:hypothetical protein, partial [Burkholderia gladioli]|uniref:hypothetical protein n=1 Tax=Burkholderia gladioli TaxID=28095 RepID=UPI001ABB769A